MRRYRHLAMGTLFELFLEENRVRQSGALAASVFEEVDRVERLLSRFDPRSEVSRINSTAHPGPVYLDLELARILEECRRGWEQTEGLFNPVALGHPAAGAASSLRFDRIEFDRSSRWVRIRTPGLVLDLGAYGKGYALDRARKLLIKGGCRSAFLHAGTSSVLAHGAPLGETGWKIGLRDPFGGSDSVGEVLLYDASLSCSAALHPGESDSDLLDPETGRALDSQSACTVVASQGTTAEMLSTALTVMGLERAKVWSAQHPSVAESIGWFTGPQGQVTLDWWKGGSRCRKPEPTSHAAGF